MISVPVELLVLMLSWFVVSLVTIIRLVILYNRMVWEFNFKIKFLKNCIKYDISDYEY